MIEIEKKNSAITYRSEKLANHIYFTILDIAREDFASLKNKRIRNVANLYHMSVSQLDDYYREGVIYDGDYYELRFFWHFLHLYRPTPNALMSLTEEEWLNLDREKIMQDYEEMHKK